LSGPPVHVEDAELPLGQFCRYITRPALSDERVQLNATGQVELKLKTPWRAGTTHLVMSPLEFMQRLAALVPPSRTHCHLSQGVFASNSPLRASAIAKQQSVIEVELPASGHWRVTPSLQSCDTPRSVPDIQPERRVPRRLSGWTVGRSTIERQASSDAGRRF